MKKLSTIIISIMFSIIIFTGCTFQKNIKIIHATDIHYLSQQLTDNNTYFVSLMKTADGKMTHYIDQITDAFIEQVITQKPDFLILSGDLTFNGELLSHIDLEQKLKKIKDIGVTVLVIPGNHDIDYPFSYGYKGYEKFSAERFQKEDYEKTYQDYGLSKAVSRDSQTFSYFYKISKDIQVLMLDVNTGEQFGTVSQDTLDWIKQNLMSAEDKKIKTIAVSHQNLLVHNEALVSNYTIDNNQELLDLFNQYNVKLNLSGHIHAQHIADQNKEIYDIATASLALYPSQYGVIDIDKKTFRISYNTQKTDISQWAKNNDVKDHNLLNYDTYAQAFFSSLSYNKLHKQLLELDLKEDERTKMAKLFADMNDYYFPGNLYVVADQLLASEGYSLWLEKQPDSRRTQNIIATLNEKRLNHTEQIIE